MRAPTPTRVYRASRVRVERLTPRLMRRALCAYARRRPRRRELERADRQVVILLGSAWGMGGTIRAALNLAGYLARTRDVEILSGYRRRDEPFMGVFPAGVKVTPLDDQRKGVRSPRSEAIVNWLRRQPSVLIHPADIRYEEYSLWSDLRLAHLLRGRAGVLIGTRPALNIVMAQLALPGFATIGEEQMNLDAHSAPLRKAMGHRYGELDALAVLTEVDRGSYRSWLDGRSPKLARIPNTVREMGAARADLDAKVVLAAGRLTSQKGFDLLIRAWRRVAEQRPDWHLRICGQGVHRAKLQRMIEERELTERITLAPAAEDLPAEMAKASIYALSSRYEGFPLVLLEAMGMGMAPVAYDCPTGPADIIDDHRNGLLVPYKKIGAMAKALLEMIEDDELRHRCGAAAAETSHSYTMEAVGPMWDELIAEVTAARRA